ncbi:MAG TPA: PepSY-like domain-containing protein [Chitinophagaceae bacterium]|nr:PepSY-like domain-containing protein [Chitinophagaceae bacterium]
MKKSIPIFLTLVALSAFISREAFSQIRQIPELVKQSFKAQYPNATHVAYTDKLIEVDVNFSDSGYQCKARYTSRGAWENTDREIKMAQLPQQVKDGFDKSKYASDWTVDQVYEVDIPDNLMEYELVVEKSAIEHKNLFFSVQGRLLSDNLSL